MAIITQRGTVDLIPEYNRALRPIFCVSEGDANSRVINLSVTSGGEAFTIPSGAMVYVAGKKQDNNIFTYGCSFTSNTVVFPITAQMSALDGIVLCELQIIQNGNPLGTANFVYWVEPSPIQNGTTSESDLNLFEEAIAKFENFDHFYADVEAMVTEAVANMQIREGQTVIDASLSVSGAAADAKATGDIVRAFMDALVTETTPTAAIATCDDAAGGLPLKRLVTNIVPTQAGSGDPSPANVRPISGYNSLTVSRTTNNLLPNTLSSGSMNGITYTVNADGTITFNGTPSVGNFEIDIPIPKGLYGRTLWLTGCPTGGATAGTYRQIFLINGSNAGNETGNGVQRKISATASTAVVRINIFNGYTANNLVFKPMLSVDKIDYVYSNGATYPVTFPTEAGTVYGGTLTVNSDGSGTLTVDRAAVDLGTLTWTRINTQGNHWRFYVIKNDIAVNATIIADRYVQTTASALYTGVQGIATQMSNTTPILMVCDEAYSTADEFKAAMDGAIAVYTIATPTTYALSAVQVAQMLAGVNNIWTDTAGTLTAEYYASTGLYVEKKVNAQRNMIAGVEEAMIATKNYSVNDLLIVGNTLYKVTAAISSGAALTVGTNIAQTTVAEQLLALANA